jgi:hypothetical protein
MADVYVVIYGWIDADPEIEVYATEAAAQARCDSLDSAVDETFDHRLAERWASHYQRVEVRGDAVEVSA